MTIPQPPARIQSDFPGSRLVSVAVPNVRSLDEQQLEAQTLKAYQDLRAKLDSAGPRHVIRMWNFIPALLEPTSQGHDRYMAFNAGRYAGMIEWFGDSARLESSAPAASGVGSSGDALTIHALATDTPGQAIQNPRQTPAVHYSDRYGPRPPCFARATRLGNTLLVSGTAAITGEESVRGDLPRQLDVTLENLAALLTAGFGNARLDLGDFTSLRVYFPRAADYSVIEQRCRSAFTRAKTFEYVNVDLCRRELLVEIEGIAVESNS